MLYDMRWVDSAITIGMASYILYLDLTEIGGTIRTLMLGSPEDIGALFYTTCLMRLRQ